MSSNRQRRAARVGTFLAAASLPKTYQRSLLPRDTIDQGISSGLVVALVYALGVVLQDGIDTTANIVAGSHRDKDDDGNQRGYSFAVSLGAIGAGLLLQSAFKQKEHEDLSRAGLRTAGYWLTAAGAAGAAVDALESVPQWFADDESDVELPAGVIPIIGALIAVMSERSRTTIEERPELLEENQSVNKLKAVGISVAVAAVIGALSFAEEKLAHTIDEKLGEYAPALRKRWLPFGHLVALGGLVGGVTLLLRRTYRKIESGAEQFETAVTDMPTSPYVSGSAESYVPWSTLSIQGRRHVIDQRTPTDIEEVMGEWAQTPIRLFVGVDSAPSEEERVQLALAELRRTKAFDREFLVVISPTGTGYVNYVFSQSVEYLSRGNCASVTIQYSKRPSPLSLDQVPEGRHHYRMLLNGIRRELKKRPASRRPKIILFGESLGAWTSQDAFMNEGTDGFEALGVHRALWIGTPAGSKWKEQVLYDNRLNVEKDEIGVFNDFGQYELLTQNAKDKLRYVMITHYNDPVAHFGTSLLIQAPAWLASDRSKRPSSVPKTTRWRTPTTFVHTLIDMKNALKPIPGQFVATGHDYRGDLANFVKITIEKPVTNDQMIRVEDALRRNEKAQADMLAGKTDEIVEDDV
ncbi:MAG: alpha/beta-hydrolase family protein [Candidatus Saccharimonadales bacterium]